MYYVIFRELFLRVIDINYEGAEPPSSLYQLRVEQFSKCFVSWSNQNQLCIQFSHDFIVLDCQLITKNDRYNVFFFSAYLADKLIYCLT